jgi:DNA helicase HerA-like ATPase
MLDVDDLLQTDGSRGGINILAADRLITHRDAVFDELLWAALRDLRAAPEVVRSRESPKLVFFFDEAHLLFTDAPKALLDKIEQVVRLIRSKGVGVYFVTQNPLDVPDTVLGQLGNRVQHALRAFTPRDQKAVKTAADTMRANPKLEHRAGDHRARRRRGADLRSSTRKAARRWSSVRSSCRRVADRTDYTRRAKAIIDASRLKATYDEAVDRESAYEKLKGAPRSRRPPAARRRVGFRAAACRRRHGWTRSRARSAA